MAIKGIDISEHNGNIDIKKIKANGWKFAIIRSSWGHFERDKQLDNNVAKCKSAGMDFGLYHYCYAINDAEARTEAKNFLALSKGYSGRTYPLVLDMEDADHYKANKGVSIQQEARTVRIFKEVIEGAGKYFMLYVNKDWHDRLRAVDAKLIDSCDLWLAHWGISKPSIARTGIWQYTSDASIPGSSKRTDANLAYKDYPKLVKQVEGGSTSKPQPTPKPPTTTPKPPTTSGGGRSIYLTNKPLYASSTATVPSSNITGTYYYWDDKTVNGRRRITNALNRVGKVGQVTGWINHTSNSSSPKMTAKQFAKEVWYEGTHGTGEARKKEAQKYGVDYNEVQRLIGILAKGGSI